MAAAELEAAVSRMLLRGRLLERAIHEPAARWRAVLTDGLSGRAAFPLEVRVLPDRVTFTGYLREPCPGATDIQVGCDGVLLYSRPLPRSCAGALRVSLTIEVTAGELAA